jgi:hypothetical protein
MSTPGPLDDNERAELQRLRAQASEMAGTLYVTRNVPPKRVVVNENCEVSYAGKLYLSGDSILMGEGPVANDFALRNLVTITDQDATEAWNGKEGDAIRAQALSFIDHHGANGNDHVAAFVRGEITGAELHKRIEAAKADAPERTHDHGFRKYQHADSHGQEVDVTMQRQRLGQQHQREGTQMTDEDAGGSK